MIEQIRLRGLGVIDEATLDIGPGFTAITGETGAGKTMVVTGLGLLLGQRADAGVVRSGAAQASVDGIWVVDDSSPAAERVREAGGDLEPAGPGRVELYLSRTVQAEGRSRAVVGGRPAPVGVLGDLADDLVAVHGQAEQLRLRSAQAQRDAVDRFGGAPIAELAVQYGALWQEHQAVSAEHDALVRDRVQRVAEAEALRLALAQIEQLAPEPGEDADLSRRAERLANAEALRAAAAEAREALSSEAGGTDVAALLGEARRLLERSGDTALAAVAEQLADIGYRVADAAVELSGFLADLDEAGPQELADVEERRAALGALIRAHGSVDAALALQETGSARLAELDDDDDRVGRLEARATQIEADLDEVARALTAARTEAAERLAEAVTAELQALAMPDARLDVTVSPAAPSATGRDEVALMLAPHPGAAPRPVSRGASGGELSRVMLAIEVVMAASDPVPTFVFDEVDAGIGGAAAIEVGRRLARLARTSQVIAVTHLAQVAAFAGNHLTVVKGVDGLVTRSSVQRLEGEAREAEMARLLSGMADSSAAIEHARELLTLAVA